MIGLALFYLMTAIAATALIIERWGSVGNIPNVYVRRASLIYLIPGFWVVYCGAAIWDLVVGPDRLDVILEYWTGILEFPAEFMEAWERDE